MRNLQIKSSISTLTQRNHISLGQSASLLSLSFFHCKMRYWIRFLKKIVYDKLNTQILIWHSALRTLVRCLLIVYWNKITIAFVLKNWVFSKKTEKPRPQLYGYAETELKLSLNYHDTFSNEQAFLKMTMLIKE